VQNGNGGPAIRSDGHSWRAKDEASERSGYGNGETLVKVSCRGGDEMQTRSLGSGADDRSQ
jgi:hypothetical protein